MDCQRLLPRGGGLLGGGLPQLDHAVEHLPAAGGRLFGMVERVGGARRPDEPGEQGRLAQRELVHGGVEVLVGGGLNAVGAVPEVDRVEVQLEDPRLRVPLLELEGEHGLADLPAGAALPPDQLVLHVLLGDGRATLLDPAVGGVGPEGADDGLGVDTAVLPEAGVLYGDHGVLQEPRDLGQGHALPVLLGVERGDEGAVRGVDPRGLGDGVVVDGQAVELPAAARCRHRHHQDEGEEDAALPADEAPAEHEVPRHDPSGDDWHRGALRGHDGPGHYKGLSLGGPSDRWQSSRSGPGRDSRVGWFDIPNGCDTVVSRSGNG